MMEAEVSHVTMGQRMHTASRSWEHRGTNSPLEPPEEEQLYCHLDFLPLYKTHFGLLEARSLRK